MSFDAVAFAMGKAGASRDLVSALMGGNGGGGGSGTLEESGWAYRQYGNVTVTANEVVISSGNKSTALGIRPPETQTFQSGDVVQIAIAVKQLYQGLFISEVNPADISVSSSTGLFSPRWQTPNGEMKCTSLGNDVLTFTFGVDSGRVEFKAATNSGSATSSAYATFDITGIKYNGTVIFGKV